MVSFTLNSKVSVFCKFPHGDISNMDLDEHSNAVAYCACHSVSLPRNVTPCLRYLKNIGDLIHFEQTLIYM